jgi:predicted oxidoreductase
MRPVDSGSQHQQNERRERLRLLASARMARTVADVSSTRQAMRSWLERHPADIEMLLADDDMGRSFSRELWLSRG